MKKEELLKISKTAFTHLLRGTRYKKTRVSYEQAEAEIVAILKKEVTEEWIEEKADELHLKLYGEMFNDSYFSGSDFKAITDFIRSLVEEINCVA